MFLSTRPIQTDNITIINRFSTSSIKKTISHRFGLNNSYQVLGIVNLDQLMFARHTHTYLITIIKYK